MDEHIISVTKLKLENKRITAKASGVDELTQQLERSVKVGGGVEEEVRMGG